MGVVRLPLRGVGREVVVVVGERGQDEPVIVERMANALCLGVVEGVGLDVAGRERPVTQMRPGRELERLVAVCLRPLCDVLEAALGHAGGEEAELHVATARGSAAVSWLTATSTQRCSREEAKTASVISAARRPSENVGIPSGAEPLRIPS